MARRISKLPAGTDYSIPANAYPKQLWWSIRDVMKRGVDVFGSAILIVIAFPLFVVVALVVATDGGPVFFRHMRVGRDGRMFGCWKFRTMIVDAETCLDEYLHYHQEAEREWKRDQKLAFDPRITPVGRFLRQSSLDELPQLFNVLLGEMSLVGPRPVTQGELAYYGQVAPLYLSVRPGITGLWQVSGRNDVGYSERVALDKQYVLHHHVLFDVFILYRTIGVGVSRRGAR